MCTPYASIAMAKPNTPEKTDFTEKISIRIQQVRDRQKINQEELAFKAGLNPAYISHLERGIYSPTLYVTWKIAKALGMTLSDLVKGL